MTLVAVAAALPLSQSACGAEAIPTTRNQGIVMKLSINVGERLMTATLLADSATVRIMPRDAEPQPGTRPWHRE